MSGIALRPRSGTELLDAAVEFLRGNFVTLASVVALGQLPSLVVGVLWPASATDPFAVWRQYPVLAALRTIFLFLVVGCWGVMFVQVVDDLMHGRPVSLGDSLRRALRRTVPATAAYALKYLVIILWMCLFILPGIWAYARYFAVMPAIAIEGLGPMEAISRSKQLARGNNLRIIAVAGIPVVLGMFVMIVLQQTAVAMGTGGRGLAMLGAVASTILYPFMAVPAIFIYYDIRTRREGLDLDVATLSSAAA
ncbi:MAG TPA: hypothetical protein VHM30_15010 [Gemmatimonadaceae bacterium]|nr:hypothetical protein [Gemmatimonadaceae bacterium]